MVLAVPDAGASAPQESGVAYSVRLNNGERVRVVVYVVSDDPKAVVVPGAPIEQRYQWNSITRSQCKKGCSGPILRAIQRFGRQGRCTKSSPGLRGRWTAKLRELFLHDCAPDLASQA